MNIGLLICGSLDFPSGGFLYDRQLVRFLRSEGHSVDVFTIPWLPYTVALFQNLSIRLTRRLRAAKLDVLLQDELIHPSTFLLNRILKRNVHYPVIAIVHHLRCGEMRAGWQNAFYRLVERKYLATPDALIFNSSTTKSSTEPLLRRSVPSIVAWPGADRLGGCTRQQIEERACLRGPLRLLFVGSVTRRKGISVLLDAMDSLRRTIDCHLTIVGTLRAEPAYAKSMMRKIRELRLESRVAILGHLDDKSLSDVYRRSHVLVVPSSYEGFGIVYAEGFRFGLPAIGTDRGAAEEVISNLENGFVLPLDQPSVLAAAIEQLFRDRSLLLAMSRNALRAGPALTTWQDTGTAVARFIRGISSFQGLTSQVV